MVAKAPSKSAGKTTGTTGQKKPASAKKTTAPAKKGSKSTSKDPKKSTTSIGKSKPASATTKKAVGGKSPTKVKAIVTKPRETSIPFYKDFFGQLEVIFLAIDQMFAMVPLSKAE